MTKFEELERLKSLKERGILTDEEFQNEKKKILNDTNIGKQEDEIDQSSQGVKICPRCTAINTGERYCNNCGIDLLNVSAYKDIKEKQDTENTDSSEGKNKIADKIVILSSVIKVLGYIGAIIVTIGCFVSLFMSEVTLQGIIICLIVGGLSAFGVWVFGLTLDARAETINLLQDIKNKR